MLPNHSTDSVRRLVAQGQNSWNWWFRNILNDIRKRRIENDVLRMNYTIPKDPNILYSYMNMMLRDRYSSFEEFCTVNDADADEIKNILKDAGYTYDPELSQFR